MRTAFSRGRGIFKRKGHFQEEGGIFKRKGAFSRGGYHMRCNCFQSTDSRRLEMFYKHER